MAVKTASLYGISSIFCSRGTRWQTLTECDLPNLILLQTLLVEFWWNKDEFFWLRFETNNKMHEVFREKLLDYRLLFSLTLFLLVNFWKKQVFFSNTNPSGDDLFICYLLLFYLMIVFFTYFSDEDLQQEIIIWTSIKISGMCRVWRCLEGRN